MRSIGLLSFAVISLLFALPAAPASPAPVRRPRYGGMLRVELLSPSIQLDPRQWPLGSSTISNDQKLAALIFDRLVALDEYGRFQPLLATEWSHDAAFRAWQFKLRPGVKFSDGTPLTGAEVATALQVLLPKSLQFSYSENSLGIRSARPAPDLLEILATGRAMIFRLAPDGALVGTGPFSFAEAIPAAPSDANPSVLKPARLKLRVNESCWSGRPYLDIIDVSFGQPPLRALYDLQIGRADLVELSPELVRKARQENARVSASLPNTLLGLRFDSAQTASDDARLREALSLSLDSDTMAGVLLQKQADPAAALLPQWLSGYAFLFGRSMNLDRAKELRASIPAAEAGGSDPLRLRIDAPGEVSKLLGERVAINARQANLYLQVVPRSGAASNAPAGLRLFAWHFESVSPRAELAALSAALDLPLAPETSSAANEPEQLYAQESRLFADNRVIPLLLLPEFAALGANVRNWSPLPWGEWRLADVWLDSAAEDSTPPPHPAEPANFSSPHVPGGRP